MREPTITIVTPSFNQGRYVEQAILSVLAQRSQIHEYFVMDGGSDDESVDIIRRYSGQLDYWVSEKDAGQADAIRRGFARATGDVLLWINADDLLLGGAIAHVRRAWAACPDLEVLTGDLVLVDRDSRITRAVRYRKPSLSSTNWGVCQVFQQSWYFRRDIYEAVGGLDPTLHCLIDQDLWIRFLLRGAFWSHLRHYLGAFRIHEASKTSSWGIRWKQEAAVLADRYPLVRAMNRRVWWGRHFDRLVRLIDGRIVRGGRYPETARQSDRGYLSPQQCPA